MEIIRYPRPEEWPELARRPVFDWTTLEGRVGPVLEAVAREGDEALRRFTRQFDGVEIADFAVPQADIDAAEAQLDPQLRDAIRQAAANIERFHAAQAEAVQVVETMPGVRCWRKALPIERVGLYIPGGSAPLFSTVLMLAVPARLAGCARVVLCTPPQRDGSVHPAILFAARQAGVTEVYRVGGAQAIAALAYGTETIPRVDKIFGPGNQYVTAAKQLAQRQGVAIDLPAGPSEVLVVADDTAVPAFVAADLLSQAEHGPDSQVVLVALSGALLDATLAELETQLATLPRADIARQALTHSRAVLLRTPDEALAFANAYAPEHLILALADAGRWAEAVQHAGSVFLGHYTPESAGDYASGTNHTLPTNGFARAWSGVSLDSFVRKTTFQHITPAGLQALGPIVETMAAAEALEAHRRAVSIRLAFAKNREHGH
ncbi:MAG: histidinol dehydrogenase [Bacteroidetes bacterium]|nr:MAG: histidinol dehydrogenase [Bacteroidota bacterium]